MNWEKFNNRLRKDAEGQNNDVDIDSIWSAIEPEVDAINTEKKKNRRGIFFWWGAGILLFSVGMWFLGNQFSQKENIVQNTDNQIITTDHKNTDLNATTKPIQEIDLGKNDTQNKNGLEIKNRDIDLSRATDSSTKLPPSSKSDVVLNENKSIDVISAIVPGIDQNEELILRGSHSSKDEKRTQKEIVNISSLITWLDFSEEKISLEKEEKVWTPPTPKKGRFSIGVYGGVNYTHRTLAEKRDEASLLLSNRETYETPLETSQIGVNFSYKILNKEKYTLEITSGLQLTSITERYKNYKNIESVSDVLGVQYLSYGLGTEPIEIMGWITETTTTEYRKEIYNTYRMIDIPLLISYNRSVGEKWQVGIKGGIFANLSLKTEGIIPNSSLSDVNLEDDEFNIFRSNVGLSYHLGFNIKRELSKRWELNISPAVRYFGNDFANDNYELSQKYVLIGGNVGINYRF